MISIEVNVLCEGSEDGCLAIITTEPGDLPTTPELMAFAQRKGWTVTGVDEDLLDALVFHCPECAKGGTR